MKGLRRVRSAVPLLETAPTTGVDMEVALTYRFLKVPSKIEESIEFLPSCGSRIALNTSGHGFHTRNAAGCRHARIKKHWCGDI